MELFKYLLIICVAFSSIATANVNRCYNGKATIGRVTVNQESFEDKLKKVPFVVWDGMRVGFGRLIYEGRMCMVQRPVVYIGSEITYTNKKPPFPLKPVKNGLAKNRQLVVNFYNEYDEKGEFFLKSLLQAQPTEIGLKPMSMLVFWDTPTFATPDYSSSRKQVSLTYTIYDADNYTEMPFDIVIEAPIVSRKQSVETLAAHVHSQIVKIKEQINALEGE